jgi:DNA-binding NarL/FixJ family response regulator
MPPATAENPPLKRIMIVEDHPVFRMGLTDLIEQENDLEVCGSSEDVHTALEAIARLRPDLLILDLALKSSNGMDLLQQIGSQYRHLPVLVLSTYDEQIYAERCLHAGARGYINKKEASESIISAVRWIFSGNIYLSENMTSKVLKKFQRSRSALTESPVHLLTNRELEVFNLIGKGMVPSAIARELCLSTKTVYSHTERIKEKLGFKHSSELVRFAALWGESTEA